MSTPARCARIIYWRAQPGQFDAYTDYLRRVVEPIDHEAQRRGDLLSFSTLVDATPGAPWTHMRLFTFETPAQRADMVAALGRAGAALTPDAAQRAARATIAAALRERVGEADYDLL
jgi:hypothetical protein